ncbi:FAD-dependent oxidoreductase [Rhizobium ruizarguesonis]|uniref:FAD-dependent oxidoreductase n=1 Tax=Rhizobium ruizarguesonis TaxID=2081791 RepID=UPI002961EFF1|nr:FAD-dependent oxidoreductase [Rhizobium ruizarguesonis]
MLFPLESALKADSKSVAASGDYDIVIVGSGISGAIIAKQAAEAGKRVLVLEAGTGANSSLAGYNDLLRTFYSAATKDNQSPFPLNANAAMPRSTQLRKLQAGETDSSTYIVQSGPYAAICGPSCRSRFRNIP